MNIQIDKRVFNEAYLPYLFDYSNRYECYYGSAGSGKSVFVAQKMLIKALNRKRKVLIIRKVGNTLRDSCFQLMKDTLHQFKIFDDCKVNKTDLTIELPNGSLFLFKGLDDPEKIKSITGITDIWIEEATEVNLNDYSQLDLRLRAKVDELQLIVSFNPTSKDNWVYKHYGFDIGVAPGKTMVLKTTYKDNRFLPQDYIDSLLAMKETNEVYYKIYVLGDFATLDKLVYSHVVTEFDWREKARQGTLCIGLDFGYVNDETALIASIFDLERKEIWIFDEVYEKGLLNNQIAARIIDKGFTKEVIIADSAEQKSIEEIKQYGIRRIKKCSKGKGSILQGVQYLQQYKIYVHPRCEGTISELCNYAWKKNPQTNEYTNTPIDKYNHLMDALRYSAQIVRRGKMKSVPIKLGI